MVCCMYTRRPLNSSRPSNCGSSCIFFFACYPCHPSITTMELAIKYSSLTPCVLPSNRKFVNRKCPLLTWVHWFIPWLQWSLSHARIAGLMRLPGCERERQTGNVRKKRESEGRENDMERGEKLALCVWVCVTVDVDGRQECWNGARKNCSSDDSSLSDCPQMDDGSAL